MTPAVGLLFKKAGVAKHVNKVLPNFTIVRHIYLDIVLLHFVLRNMNQVIRSVYEFKFVATALVYLIRF